MSEANDESRADNQARAQVRSIVEMVAALQCDYDRLNELREKAKEGHWVAGWNMPGYMPDSQPAAFDTCDEARDYLAQEMQRAADEEEGEDRELSLTDASRKIHDAIGNKDEEFGATIAGYHYWISHEPGKLADAEEQKELDELEESAGDCEDEDAARQRIEEDPLSIEVRGGWHSPGEDDDGAAEFRIVLCTGGPHVELVGDLDEHCQPDRVRVLYSDWGTSGELFDFDRETVLTYCRTFYFGE